MLGYYTKALCPFSASFYFPANCFLEHWDALYREKIEKKPWFPLQREILGGFSAGVKCPAWHWPWSRSRHRAWALPLSPQQRLPVISSPHLAAPGVPPSITGHCLGSTQLPPPPPAQWLLVNNPVCSHPESDLILAPFIPNTIHPSTAGSTCLVRKMRVGEGGK